MNRMTDLNAQTDPVAAMPVPKEPMQPIGATFLVRGATWRLSMPVSFLVMDQRVVELARDQIVLLMGKSGPEPALPQGWFLERISAIVTTQSGPDNSAGDLGG